MTACPDWLTAWLSCEAFLGLTAFSLFAFVGTLLAIPAILIRLPEDYFENHHGRDWLKDHHPVLRTIGHVLKNLIGGVFLFAGFLMLFLPGQGLLTMVIGVFLLDFPGKRNLECKILRQPSILHAVNSLRKKFRKAPLRVPKI